MLVTLTPITILQLEKVHFYSVKLAGKPTSEFRDFYERMKLKEADLNEFNGIVTFLKELGLMYGAGVDKFKQEGIAQRVDQPLFIEIEEDDRNHNDFGLRLYCYRINDEVVLLFNGDRKTVSGDVMRCDNCRDYFLRANDLAKIIKEAFDSENLFIESDFIIQSKDGFTLNL